MPRPRLSPVLSNGLLYQGGVKPLSRYRLSERIEALLKAEISTVVNVTLHDDELAEYFDHILTPFGDNRQFVDHLDDLYATAESIGDRLRCGRKVLTLCYYGVNRSGLVNSLAVRDLYACTGREALARVRALRPGACKGNKHFEQFLRDLPAPGPVVLFDLDGTLLLDNIYPPQAAALTSAIEETFGVSGAAEAPVDWVGKTDLQLAREISLYLGVTEEEFNSGRDAYLFRYERLFYENCPPSLEDCVRPGVRDVLEALQPYEPRVVTGNTRAVAALKLQRAGFDGLLNLRRGGYGDQAEDRAALVKLARRGRPAVLIGDTHRDMAAAWSGGARSIGLVTPKHSASELVGADRVADGPDELPGLVGELAPL